MTDDVAKRGCAYALMMIICGMRVEVCSTVYGHAVDDCG